MITGTQKDSVAASAERFINEVRTKNENFYATDRGQGALRDLKQTFPHTWLYVGELLQNAVDAGAKHIRLAVDEVERSLLVEHDGVPFNSEHVEALCVRGMSKKGAGTVGFMGIGFKAVFQSFECVDVSSGPWRFGFRVSEVVGEFGDRQRNWLGCVLPEYSETILPPSEGMTCHFFLHRRLDRLGPIADDVTNVLSPDLLVLALLARRGVEEVEWVGERWLLAQTEQVVDDHITRVVLTARHHEDGEMRQWVLFSAKYQPSRAAIARFLEHRQIQPRPEERDAVYAEAQRERTVEVFCPLDEHDLPNPPKHGQAYALLPTGVQVPLGLHVQADWLLVTSRREIMEVETNEWHREILARLAGLIRAYLSWVTTLDDVPERTLTESYSVLPDWSETDGAFASYLQDTSFRESLRSALAELSFLPVRAAGGLRFITPSQARVVPSVLRSFDDTRYLPWVLLGDYVLSTAVLGTRALGTLSELQLLRDFNVDDLVARWETGVVGAWRQELGTPGPDAHLRLLRALSTLDETPAWRNAKLRCLPAADGGWISRASTVGLPLDWDSIPYEDPEPPLRSLVEPYLAAPNRRLEWSFDRSVRRDPAAQQYLQELPRDKFENVLGSWWEGLPDHPDEATQSLVLDTTCWVLLKQKQRTGLVLRVLCEDGILTPLDCALLADPYAASARRRFFAGYPVVSGRYLHHKPGFSDADWRSFFEAANKDLKGPLRLRRTAAELSHGALRKRLPDYDPPGTKSWAINTKYGPWSLYSRNYLLVDVTLPKELIDGLKSPTRDAARDLGAWMHEARQMFAANHLLQIAYVPYNSSSVWDPKLPYPASWVSVLQTSTWVCAVGGNGPYVPASVLARSDPARPEAPVADLSSELVAILQQCGIVFGSDIPEVASLERLRREGPTATPDRLLELLDAAIKDSESSAEYRAELQAILESAILPVRQSITLIDGATRIGANRLVRRSARGAELGGWLLSIEGATADLEEKDPYTRLLALAGSLHEVPDSPSSEQALSFLIWVWQKRPDAELVRRILPRAYRLITDDLTSDSREDTWRVAREIAMVYVASRKWVSVLSDDLFFDDLADDRLKGLVAGLLLATPGHLGENTEEQYRVADILGMRRLSSRLQVVPVFEDELPLPGTWMNALDAIMDLLASCAREDDASNSPTSRPQIAYFARITKSLVDSGETKSSWRVYAARDTERLCIAGDPDDFAADLCRVLLQWAGLANRRDLDELAPVVTQLIGWLNRPEKFGPRLQSARSQRDLVPPQESPTETHPPADGATSPAAAGSEEPIPPPPPSPPPPGVPPTPPTPPPPSLGGTLQETPEATPPPTSGPDVAPPPVSGGYTTDDRERRLQSLRKRQTEIEAQVRELLGVGPIPPEAPPDAGGEEQPRKTFASDVPYRQAVVEYEHKVGRYAETKDAGQPGYDIDSFDKPLDDPSRRLVRRIEVKGHGCEWTQDDTVELSDRQFLDAVERKVDDHITRAEDFDYWLYVVERFADGTLNVIPIKNPSKWAAKFEFRAGTWRALAEQR